MSENYIQSWTSLDLPVFTACPPKLLREGWEELEVELCMSNALCDDSLPSRSLGEDLVIHKAFDRFFRVGLDCFAMLAMTHGTHAYLLTVKKLRVG